MTHDELMQKHPKILGPARYLGVNEGWFPLIDNLCSYLQFHIDNNKVPQVEAVQVKEKFGGLRFYVGEATIEQHAVIDFVESLSLKTCEVCGAPGRPRGRGWIKTVCDEHAE